MRIRKYDFDYGRRMLLGKAAVGAAAGVLTPLWPLIAKGNPDVSRAYPEELLSIELYTKGKVKPGDVITAENVDLVKDLLDPIGYTQVKTMGRRINIVESTKDITKLYPYQYLEATLKNKGRAKFGDDGNVYDQSGTPWIGGAPFPDPQDALQAIANLTLGWGRHNFAMYAVRDWDIAPDGSQAYQHDFVWAELQIQSRVDGTVFHNLKDLIRLHSVWFTAPQDQAGTSFLSHWYYDQRKFPDLYGNLPSLRRVRQFPTNQRFEPLVPGITFFLSDFWATGDPMFTWGNYKVVGRQPMLGAVGSRNFMGGYDPNWERPVHGGPKDQTFFDVWMELIPEALIVEAEPVGFPRAPVSKKRIWVDVRNGAFVGYNTYDRRGEIWKSFDPIFAQYSNDKVTIKDETGHPVWTWCAAHCHDIQANRMTRFVQAKAVTGGYESTWHRNGIDVYNKYLTNAAIARLGRA